jgi:hypothetical protein
VEGIAVTASGTHPNTDPASDTPRVDEFLRRFFGPGNDANLYPQVILSFVQSLQRGDDAPAVLPRFVKDRDEFALYVIADSPSAITSTAALIEAFAGPTYCSKGDTMPAELDPDDSVEAAVIDFAGMDRTFIVEAGSNPGRRAKLRVALTLMQQTVASRPERLWHIAKPIGRLLAEFEASLAAGGEAASLTILDQIAAQGGVTATNLAYLRIRRLDALGRSEELLSMDGLANVLRQDPPLPIKEAVLNAVYSTSLSEPLQQGAVAAACDALRDTERPLPLPLHDNIAQYGDEAAATLMTAAVGRRDQLALEGMTSVLLSTGRVSAVPRALWNEATSFLQRSGTPASVTRPEEAQAQNAEQPEATQRQPEEPESAEPPAGQVHTVTGIPVTWPALFDAVGQDSPATKAILRDETWQDWPSPAESDEEIGQILDRLADEQWARVWHLAGPFIQAVGYGDPAPRTAQELITYALTFDRLGPGDLIALQALTEIYLRASPSASDYRLLLEEITDSCPQWVSPENALVALDFADRLVLAACPYDSARMNLAIALLDPLNSRQGRLEGADLDFARQLSDELGIPLEWRTPHEQPDEGRAFTSLPSMSVLLYSLDTAVLDRTSAELKRLVPSVKIAISHDKVGTDTLKRKSHNADVVVLATRCAKHAATGFITENARAAVITYADGSGSASLLRAATDGLSRAARGT